MSGNCPTPLQAPRMKYSLEFLTDFSGSVLDAETRELIEYCHLIQRPKYKDKWGYSFRNKIERLAQGMPGQNNGTNALLFVHTDKVPEDRWKEMTYGKIVCNV